MGELEGGGRAPDQLCVERIPGRLDAHVQPVQATGETSQVEPYHGHDGQRDQPAGGHGSSRSRVNRPRA